MKAELTIAAQLAGAVISFSLRLLQSYHGILQVIWLVEVDEKEDFPKNSEWRSKREQDAIKKNLMSAESLEQVMSKGAHIAPLTIAAVSP
jgi:hypothetical protein